jgi:hypothetical protein
MLPDGSYAPLGMLPSAAPSKARQGLLLTQGQTKVGRSTNIKNWCYLPIANRHSPNATNSTAAKTDFCWEGNKAPCKEVCLHI